MKTGVRRQLSWDRRAVRVSHVPSEAIFVGIEFKVGTSLRIADTISIVDAGIACPMRDLAASGSTGVGGLPRVPTTPNSSLTNSYGMG